MLYNQFLRRITVTLTVAENHARTLRIALEEQGHGRRAGGRAAGDGTPESVAARREAA
jgi:hypothetical protein